MSLSLQVNIILILSTIKKTIELSFCSRLKNNALMVSTVTFAFKIIGPIISSGVKKVSFSRRRKVSLIKGVFPQPRKLSLIKEVFYSQEHFHRSRKFSTNKKVFQKKCLTKQIIRKNNLLWSRKSSTKKEVFQRKLFLIHQRSFPQSKYFSKNKDFSTVKRIFCKQRSKRLPKSEYFRSIYH